MSINSVNPLAVTGTASSAGTASAAKTASSVNFADVLGQFMNDAEQAQAASNVQTNALLSGNVENLHDVTIASTEAELTLSLAVQVRNKVVDAYNEIMRMQV